MYLLGYDVGSSSIKVALVDASNGKTVDIAFSPEVELEINSEQTGWAEQDPEIWWNHICIATKKIIRANDVNPNHIQSVGIAYQMHGLVLVDHHLKPLRPAIIWCDSRAIEIGNNALKGLGPEYCFSHLLNGPGNFTATRLKWVNENEESTYSKIYKAMLPGDFIALKLTGEVNTTISGLSEGIFWDFKNECIADELMKYLGLDSTFLPTIVPINSIQGRITEKASRETGLAQGIPVTYRAGDQPNNAMSLGVLHSGEIAATGGTSGVVYGVSDEIQYDIKSRVNSFAHVNHTHDHTSIGQLLCINGAGSLYAWIRQQFSQGRMTYLEMEDQAQRIPIGSEGLKILPFGNGAERMLQNEQVGAHFINVQFNRHELSHIFRAALEGLAFSFFYGIQILKSLGVVPKKIRVGNDNLFQSEVFSSTLSHLADCEIEMIDTTGAVGAAKASGIAVGIYQSIEEAFSDLSRVGSFFPSKSKSEYDKAYLSWENELQKILKS